MRHIKEVYMLKLTMADKIKRMQDRLIMTILSYVLSVQ